MPCYIYIYTYQIWYSSLGDVKQHSSVRYLWPVFYLVYKYISCIIKSSFLSTPMGIDYVVIGFDMEVQPLGIHNAASPLCSVCERCLHRCREQL